MACELFVVPPEQVGIAWADIKRHISRIENAPWDLNDVLHDLMRAKAQAWGIREDGQVTGVIITRIENTFAHRYGLTWIAAGSGLDAGMPFYREVIEPWLWDQGCEWIDLCGRKGWKRALPDYEEVTVTLRKYR